VASAVCLLAVFAASATPSFAAQSSFSATYTETTTPQTCPRATPPGAFCYTGIGTGPTVPPGGNGTENFAGFVDQNRADPVTHCAPDFNAVSISTARGTLFLTTQGNACPVSQTVSHDQGTWRAFGGTGVFNNATGSGVVSTDGTFNADGTISSVST